MVSWSCVLPFGGAASAGPVKAVTHSAQRGDVPGLVGHGFQFLAQVSDVHVDVACFDERIIPAQLKKVVRSRS